MRRPPFHRPDRPEIQRQDEVSTPFAAQRPGREIQRRSKVMAPAVNKEQVSDDCVSPEITRPVLAPEIDNRDQHRDHVERPNTGDSLPDEMSVTAQIQLTAGVAIAVSQNKAAEDKEEINPEVTAVPKTKLEDIQIK